MSRRYRVARNSQKQNEIGYLHAHNMNQYLQPKKYMENYAIQNKSVKNQLKEIAMKEFQDEEKDVAKLNPDNLVYSIGGHQQHIKSKLHQNEDKFGGLNQDHQGPYFDSRTIEYAQYFGEANKLPDMNTRLFLEEPPARENTSHDKFGMFPCNGGVKGPAQYFKAGTKIMVKWQIQNPTKDGKCIIRLAENNDENAGSYKNIRPIGIDEDQYTGYFNCGNTSGNPEGTEIVIPAGTDCAECTLQFAYNVPDFGEIYQCTDISTVKIEGTQDCDKPCLNGGICFKGECVCAKGFYGKYCEQSTEHPGSYVDKNERNPSEPSHVHINKRDRKSNGINYLENTEEAEVPPEYYFLKEENKPAPGQEPTPAKTQASTNIQASANTQAQASKFIFVLYIQMQIRRVLQHNLGVQWKHTDQLMDQFNSMSRKTTQEQKIKMLKPRVVVTDSSSGT